MIQGLILQNEEKKTKWKELETKIENWTKALEY